MLHLIFADWRRLLIVQIFGMLFWAIVTYLVIRQFVLYQCCPDLFTKADQIRYQIACFGFGQFPLLFWIQGSASGLLNRQRLLATLPWSASKLNLSRLLTAAMFFVLGLGPWAYTWAIWLRYEYHVYVWLLILVALSAVCFFFLSMRYKYARFGFPSIFPLLIIPEVQTWLLTPLEWMVTPWASLAVALFAVPFGLWAMKQPDPRWAC